LRHAQYFVIVLLGWQDRLDDANFFFLDEGLRLHELGLDLRCVNNFGLNLFFLLGLCLLLGFELLLLAFA